MAHVRSRMSKVSESKVPESKVSEYTPPPPHRIPEEAAKFLETLTEKERQLHELAIELLGSSYFVETSHAFKSRPTPPKKSE
jgi:hypothetical protein